MTCLFLIIKVAAYLFVINQINFNMIRIVFILSAIFATSFSQNETCNFDDTLLIANQEGEGGRGVIQTNLLSTQWDDHGNKVPALFCRRISTAR